MLGAALRRFAQPVATFGVERWESVADEAPAIGAEHFAEVERGVDPRRKYKLDKTLMGVADERGVLMIFTARVNGKLAGYITWQLGPDIESEGLLVAIQGAWFVRPGYNAYHLGSNILDGSIEELKRRGVQCIFPHHRLQGRGARLGLLFRRRGWVEIKHEYMGWIGGD